MPQNTKRWKRNTFLYPVFSWPTPHPKVCRTETRTEFKTEYDDKWALIIFLASKCNLLLQVWDKVREQVRDSIRDGLRWSLWKCRTASLGSYEQSHKRHIAQRNDDNQVDRVDKQEEYGAPAAPVVDSYGSPQAAPLARWLSYSSNRALLAPPHHYHLCHVMRCSSDSYGSPAADPVSQDSYGSPQVQMMMMMVMVVMVVMLMIAMTTPQTDTWKYFNSVFLRLLPFRLPLVAK